LRIFEAIAAKGTLTCKDLATLRDVAPATISLDLKILRMVELIECREEGQFVDSRTIGETIAEYTEWLALVSKSIGGGRNARKR
jgi:DNA-binding transcriptional ArsR family regulator